MWWLFSVPVRPGTPHGLIRCLATVNSIQFNSSMPLADAGCAAKIGRLRFMAKAPAHGLPLPTATHGASAAARGAQLGWTRQRRRHGRTASEVNGYSPY